MTRNYIDLTDSIKKYIKNQSIVFVFPTEVAAKGWADWTIKNNQITIIS